MCTTAGDTGDMHYFVHRSSVEGLGMLTTAQCKGPGGDVDHVSVQGQRVVHHGSVLGTRDV